MFSPIVRRCRKEENIVIFRRIGKLEAKAESFEMIEGKIQLLNCTEKTRKFSLEFLTLVQRPDLNAKSGRNERQRRYGVPGKRSFLGRRKNFCYSRRSDEGNPEHVTKVLTRSSY